MLSRDKRRAPSARAGFRNVASLRRPHMIKSAGEGFFMGFLRGLSRVTEKLRANLAPAILLQAASCVDTRATAMPITGDLVRIVTNLLLGGLAFGSTSLINLYLRISVFRPEVLSRSWNLPFRRSEITI